MTAGFMLLEFIHSIESFLLTMIPDWNIPMVEDSSKKDTLLKEDAIHTNSIENISLTSKIDLNSTFDIQSTSSSVETVVTPKQIRPFSKAPLRKISRCWRRKDSTRILTDTPVKQAIELELLRKNSKKRKINFIKKYDVKKLKNQQKE